MLDPIPRLLVVYGEVDSEASLDQQESELVRVQAYGGAIEVPKVRVRGEPIEVVRVCGEGIKVEEVPSRSLIPMMKERTYIPSSFTHQFRRRKS